MVLVDCGANADSKPDHLPQFAYMGAAFARDVLGIESPRVGLLSIGEEAGKGNSSTQEAHALSAAARRARLLRQRRGARHPRGTIEVVVTDGFTGNVCLKLLEGAADFVIEEIRAAAGSSARGEARRRCSLKPSLRAVPAQVRPRGLRRRLPGRPARHRGHRPRHLEPDGRSQRHPVRGGGARNDVVGRARADLARPASTATAA